MKFRVVQASCDGPSFYEFDSLSQLASCLMAWRVGGSYDKTSSCWKLIRGKWVPVWPWQLTQGMGCGA